MRLPASLACWPDDHDLPYSAYIVKGLRKGPLGTETSLLSPVSVNDSQLSQITQSSLNIHVLAEYPHERSHFTDALSEEPLFWVKQTHHSSWST